MNDWTEGPTAILAAPSNISVNNYYFVQITCGCFFAENYFKASKCYFQFKI